MKFKDQLEELLSAAYTLTDDSTEEDHAAVGKLIKSVIAREKMLHDALLQITFEGSARSVYIAQGAVAKACFWEDE